MSDKLHLDVYTDGSYNSNHKAYSGGLVILMEGLKSPLEHKTFGTDPRYTPLANIAGELLAAMQALSIAEKAGAGSICIHHDYAGIDNWTRSEKEPGYWCAKKILSKAYVTYVNSLREKGMIITFKHIRGHTGDKYNERADFLAKEAMKECIASSTTF